MFWLAALAFFACWYVGVGLAIRRVPPGEPLPLAGLMPRPLAHLLSPAVLLLALGVAVMWLAYWTAVAWNRLLGGSSG